MKKVTFSWPWGEIKNPSHGNSTDEIFPKKKRKFLNGKGGTPPHTHLTDENLKKEIRQNGNFCPFMGHFVLVIIYPCMVFTWSISGPIFHHLSSFSPSIVGVIASKHNFDKFRLLVYPLKISLMAVLIDFGKDFLQIINLTGQCRWFRRILWFYLRIVIER